MNEEGHAWLYWWPDRNETREDAKTFVLRTRTFSSRDMAAMISRIDWPKSDCWKKEKLSLVTPDGIGHVFEIRVEFTIREVKP